LRASGSPPAVQRCSRTSRMPRTDCRYWGLA
jgi:hypothetical protein